MTSEELSTPHEVERVSSKMTTQRSHFKSYLSKSAEGKISSGSNNKVMISNHTLRAENFAR